MAWPYHFVNLSEAEKHHRRDVLARYGVYAQLSALAPILAYQLYRLGVWVHSDRERYKKTYSVVTSSPNLKQARKSKAGAVARKWRSTLWWLEGESFPGWGLRGHWIAAISWTTWLLFLCIPETGDDYVHITRRFGIMAAAQLPLHYLLSMKSRYSPLAFAFRSSHEHVNAWHRLSGRIIYFFLLLHASFYMNFFLQNGILFQRLSAPVVIIGVLAFCLISIIGTTSLAIVRRWSYRLFFITHLIIGVSILPLLYFHASPLHLYTAEALTIFVLDLIFRKLDTVTGFAKVTSIPHTKLVKLQIPIPRWKVQRFRKYPGQHVYLSIPKESVPTTAPSPYIHDLLFNPFTVVEVSSTDVTLVLRALHGPTTTTLHQLASLSKANPPINIEGPYGSSRRFPDLAKSCDRILLVAGGVGATFTLPIYWDLREKLSNGSRSPDKLKFTWALRSAAEAKWAMSSKDGKTVEGDENVKIFITRRTTESVQLDEEPTPVEGSVELDELLRREESISASGGHQRPDLRKIVDETFKYGNDEHVAVLVCGPAPMARELRRHVGIWVNKGRNVWWHDETFGL